MPVFSLFTVLAFLSSATPLPGDQAPRPSALARAAAVAFMARLQASDVAGAIALCDLPFITHEQKTLQSEAWIKSYFKGMTAQVRPEQQPNTVLSVKPYAETRKQTADDVLAVRDPVLRDGGYVVFVGRGGKQQGVLLVRVRAKVARVVGIG